MYPFNKERALRGEEVINGRGEEILGLNERSDSYIYRLVDKLGRSYDDLGCYYVGDKENHSNLHMATPDVYFTGAQDVVICKYCHSNIYSVIGDVCGNCRKYEDEMIKEVPLSEIPAMTPTHLPDLSAETTPKVEIMHYQGSYEFILNVFENKNGDIELQCPKEHKYQVENCNHIGKIKITLNKKDFIKE